MIPRLLVYWLSPLLLAAAAAVASIGHLAAHGILLGSLALAACIATALAGAHARRSGEKFWPRFWKIFLVPVGLLAGVGLGAPITSQGATGASRLPMTEHELWAFALLALAASFFAIAWHLTARPHQGDY